MKQLGSQHPDRDAQFRFISDTAEEFLNNGEPVISVDTKKKENIGKFKNNGSEYRHKKDPRQVLDHDFPLPELGEVAPYRIYGLNNNTVFINLGLSHDTPEFAGESVYQWWQCIGKNTFPKDVKTAITQIHSQKYPERLEHYKGNLILVGINYDEEIRNDQPMFKHHSCKIERA